MALHVKSAGAWKEVLTLFAKHLGTWKPVQAAYVKEGGVWKQFYQDEVTVTLSSTGAPVNLKSLFTPEIWASSRTKRVIIPVGVTIGTNINAYAMFPCPTADGQAGSFGGDLIVDNYGVIAGIGGAANSGVGGSVLYGNLPGKDGRKMIVNNKSTGIIRAGGGGGGRAGNGGGGVWYSGRTVTEGPTYAQNSYHWLTSTGYDLNGTALFSNIMWAGVEIYRVQGQPLPSSYASGGWTYYSGGTMRGTQNYEGDGGANVVGTHRWYDIYRQTTVYDVPNYTSGGTGGSGGRGQGYDGANASGAGGSAGGTNAGAGGTGGTGGGWGATGNTGNTGASGNYSSGAAGAAGGLAGFYLNGAANIQLNNSGTVQGRVQ